METEIKSETKLGTNKLSTPLAIIVAGALVAGAVYFSSLTPQNTPSNNNITETTAPAEVGKEDRTLGNPKAKVTVILYEDFQCPYCGAVSGFLSPPNEPLIQSLKQRDPNWTPFLPEIMNYVKKGDVLFVYRDWAFLGSESVRAAEAARCAGDQEKFWEYHDYLYAHQNGENEGSFSDANLKSFAKNLGLNTVAFDRCLDESKYAQAVENSRSEGANVGVNGTPKGFILRDGKVVDTIDGAGPGYAVKEKIDAALK